MTQPGPEIFVGRHAELNAIHKAIKSAAAGHGQIVAIFGDPGIGKSALARRATNPAGTGLLVGTGYCREQRDAPPYRPWKQAYESATRSRPGDSLFETTGDGSTGSEFLLFDSTVRAITTHCLNQPTALLLEDVHWSDEGSARFLEFLGPELSTIPLIVIVTARRDEIRPSSSIDAALAGLSKLDCFTSVELDGLEDDDVVELAGQIHGKGSLQADAAAIRRVTGGNPFFARELILAESGLEERTAGSLGVTAAIQAMIRDRTKTLKPEVQEALQIAAVIGESFRLDYLQAVTGQDDMSGLLQLLAPAETSRIIQADDNPGSRRFRHAMVRYALQEQLSPSIRTQLHFRIAETIRRSGLTDESAPALAYHYSMAIPLTGPEKAFEYSFRAGLQAFREMAFADAQWHLTSAIGLSVDMDDLTRARLFEALAVTQNALAQDVRDYQRIAFDAWLRLEDIESAVRTASHPISTNDTTVAHEMHQAALNIAPPGTLLRAKILNRSLWHSKTGIEGARPIFDEAEKILRENPDPWTETWLRGRWGSGLSAPGRYPEALEQLERAANLAQAVPDPEAEVHASFHAAVAACALGKSTLARRYEEECRLAASRSRRPMRHHMAARVAIGLASAAGDYPTIDDLCAQAASTDVHGKRELSILAAAQAERDRRQLALDHLNALNFNQRELAGQSEGSIDHQCTTVLAKLRVADALDDDDLADDAIGEIARLSGLSLGSGEVAFDLMGRISGQGSFEVVAAANLGLHAQRLPFDFNNALLGYLSDYSRILLPDTGAAWIHVPLSLDRVVGRVAAAVGDVETATERLRTAIGFCEGAGFWPEAAWAHHDLAHTIAATNEPTVFDDVNGSLDACSEIAEKLGVSALLNRVKQLRSTLRGRGNNARTGATTLSRRETEVMGLIAAGMTNRQIAAELVLSERTVQRHIANIYAKIKVSNRSQATAYALSHGYGRDTQTT